MTNGKKLERTAAAAIALVTWFGLALQFYLIMFDPAVAAIAAAARFVNYFSYFTVPTNLIVAVTLTIALVPSVSSLRRFCLRARTRTAVVYITVVGLVYSLVLRSVWDPGGLHLVADHVLHDAVLVLYVLFWLIFVDKRGLRWMDPLAWLAYTVLYMSYSLIRGAITGWYPYPFADVSKLGYPIALGNTGMIIAGFFVVGMVFVSIAKLTSATAKTAAT